MKNVERMMKQAFSSAGRLTLNSTHSSKQSSRFLFYSRASSFSHTASPSGRSAAKIRSPLRTLLDQQAATAAAAATQSKTGKMQQQQANNVELQSSAKSNGTTATTTIEQAVSSYRWDNRMPVPSDGPIGTHSGKFHCDEVLAVAMLKLLPEFQSRAVVRSRNAEELAKCSIVVDVGGEFNPPRHRYDHHQKSFVYSMRHLQPSKQWDIKLSSSGLIYCYFGRDIIAHVLEWNIKQRLSDVDKIYDKVYENFMQEIDAIDNGIKLAEKEQLRYQISTNLSTRVSFYNPSWNEKSSPDLEMQRFVKAMSLVRDEFIERIQFYARVWLPARASVEQAVKARYSVDTSGDIIAFDSGACPWKEHLADIEAESNGTMTPVKLVVFPDVGPNAWRVQGVPLEPHSFDLRVPLPLAWRSLRDQDLQHVSGVPDAGFCHTNGFIGGASTREGALKMAQLALQIHRREHESTSDDVAMKRQRI